MTLISPSFSRLHRPKQLLAPVFALALIAANAGCGDKSTQVAAGGGRAGGGGSAPVLVGQVHRKVVPILIDAIGAVEPIRSAAIRAQVTGALMKIAIQEGQDVNQGDLLFEIDPRPFQNALASAQADREKILVQLETARAQVVRYRALSDGSMVSKEQFQQYQDNERALAAQSLSSDAAVANAKLQLEYCSIRASISGRTGNLNIHEGDMVRAGDAGAMVTINQLSPIYVTFSVPQQYLATLTRYLHGQHDRRLHGHAEVEGDV
jgi:multidrug efflux system membrane fusion protein